MSRFAQNIKQLPAARIMEAAASGFLSTDTKDVPRSKYHPSICVLSVSADCHLAVEIPLLPCVLDAPSCDKLVLLCALVDTERRMVGLLAET